MRFLTSTFAAAALLLSAGAAMAADPTTYELDLFGQIGTADTGSFESGGFHIDYWNLSLGGLDPEAPITVLQGDRIQARVYLDHALTIPTSQILTSFDLYFGSFGDTFPPGDVMTSGSVTYSFEGSPFKTALGGTGTAGQIISGYTLFPPNNEAFTFDSFFVDFTVNELHGPVQLDFAGTSYQLRSDGVPEPAAWALMILGFGGVGATMRSRRRLGAGVSATART